jgi:hypothetical protein
MALDSSAIAMVGDVLQKPVKRSELVPLSLKRFAPR